MYDRMVREHGYSVRRLAQKLGKDKGYLENRLRLADAPEEVRELVSLRKDTLSHAYELMKVEDPKKRRRLAAQVAKGELTLIKLRDKIEGRPARSTPTGPFDDDEVAAAGDERRDETRDEAEAAWTGRRKDVSAADLSDDSLVAAKQQLSEAVEAFMDILRAPDVIGGIAAVDRANLAKYLTIAKLRLENAIAVVRSEG
jgi:ParB-like chromosome segregation protein Spo0J